MSNERENEDDPVLARIPVVLVPALSSYLSLVQYPARVKPFSAEGGPLQVRLKSRSQQLELVVPVHTDSSVYDKDRAKQLGEGAGLLANQQGLLDKLCLRGSAIETTGGNYCVGVLSNDGVLHLTPVANVTQCRPELSYLDSTIDEVIGKKNLEEGKTSAVQVQVKTNAELELQAHNEQQSQIHWQRQMEEEPWLQYHHHDVESELAQRVFEQLMLPPPHSVLSVSTTRSGYLKLLSRNMEEGGIE